MKRLSNSFFNRKTLAVAEDLIGKYLVRKIGNKLIREKITEVEAYVGPHDLACHSSKGRTARTEVMHCEAGTLYIHLIYGIHWMLNIVTEEKDYPAGILLRSTEHIKGPGVITRELKIDKKLNGRKLGPSAGLWIEDGEKVSKKNISKSPRIGVSYAGPIWSAKPYRFALK